MKKLGVRNYELLREGAKACGADAECVYSHAEERLYSNEAREILAFLKWCEKNNSWFGSGNYEQRFAEFKNSGGKKHFGSDDDYESKEAKLDALEEELASLESAFEKGDMESEEYQHDKNRITKEIQRVEGIPIDGERAEAYDIWQDVKKQFAEGKMSVLEYEKYKKMFENYQFTAPKNTGFLETRDFLMMGGVGLALFGFTGFLWWYKNK